MRKLYLLLFAVFFQLMAFSQSVTIGTGTNTSSNSPWNAYYGYSYVQTIYLSSEISASGNITSVQFYYAGAALDNSDSITMYMGNTAKSSFATTTDWEPVTNLTPVFSGLLTGYTVPGWVTVTLTTPFAYSGSSNLLIAVDENKTGYNTATRFQGTTITGSNRVLAYSNDATNPDPATPPTGTRSSIVGNIIIDGLTLASCQPVTGLAISGVTQTGADASWSAPASGNSPAQYNYEVRTSGAPGSGTTGLVSSGNASSTNTTLAGLTPGISYTLSVRSDCGSGSYSSWVTTSFVTLCASVSGFTENFDGITQPALPTCWAKVGTQGAAYTQTASPNSSPNTLYIYGSSATAQAVISMPPVNNANSNNHQLRFQMRANFTIGGIIEVGYLTNPADSSTFVLIEDVTAATLTYQSYTVIPTGLTDTSVVFAFRHLGTPAYSVLIDDVSWEAVPSCVEPNTLIISNITSGGAQLDWTAPAVSSPASYDVYYNTSNTAPTAATIPTATGITATTYNLNTLASATKYFVWVRSNCGGGSVSVWSAADSFYTACLPVPAFSENFDGVTTPSLPTCWSSILRGATLSTFATVTTTTGNAFSMPNAVAMYNSSSTSTDDIILVSPPVSNLAAGTYQLSFYAKNSSLGQDIEVGTLDNNSATATFTPIETVTVTTAYQKFTVSFAGYSGTDTYIGIRRLNAGTYTYVYVDNVNWELIPSCIEPNALMISNIASTSAQLDWTAPSASSPASYEVYYSTSNIAPTATTTPTAVGITSTTYNLGILATATQYFVWVRSNCGSGNTSVWSVADSFYTACNAVNIPYTQDFESVTVPAIPVCTSIENVGTGNNWLTAANPGSGFTSKTLQYRYNGTNPADAWFYTQGLNLTAGVSYRLGFRYGNNSTTYVESMNVNYGTSPSASAMTEAIIDYPSITGATASTSYTDFTPAATGVYYIGFHAYSIANQYNLFVDDISVNVPPTCDLPLSPLSSNITGSDAQIDWTAPATGSPASYELYYSTNSATPSDSTTPSVTGITSTTYNLSGLAYSTTYYVWVRSNCGAGGTSVWSVYTSFTTACGVIATPTVAPEPFGAVLPNCWGKAKGLLADPSTTFTSTTASNWVIDDFGNRTATINKSARLNIWTTTTNDWLMTPSYDLGAAGGNLRLEFDLAYTSYLDSAVATLGVDDKFAVVISTDNGATWSLANALRTWDATTPISNTGEHVIIDLTGYTGTVMFAFYGESTVSNADNNVYVDNVEITQVVMPVTLLNFRGARQGAINMLSWATATEQTNKGFELQRSATGEVFSTIGFVSSKAVNGNSSSTLNYNYADEKPLAGNNYYRLKQVDKDGKASVSNVVLVKGAKTNAIVLSSVYPNPAKNILNVVLSAPANDKVSVIVTDLAGKVIMQTNSQLITGDNNLTIHVGSLPSGTYLVKAVCNNGCETSVSRFVKQ